MVDERPQAYVSIPAPRTIWMDGDDMIQISTRAMMNVFAHATACALLTACGVDTYKLDPGEIEASAENSSSWKGAPIELVRRATGCGDMTPRPLLALVNDAIEFPSDTVETLKSACGIDPAVTIDLAEHSIVFDFSEVEEPGNFGNDGFDGYVVSWFSFMPEVAGASIDLETTSVAFPRDRIVLDGRNLAVDFADWSFDAATFIKVDLAFEDSPATE